MRGGPRKVLIKTCILILYELNLKGFKIFFVSIEENILKNILTLIEVQKIKISALIVDKENQSCTSSKKSLPVFELEQKTKSFLNFLL